ncbi:hypothetical protein CGRA01v4_09356 [Colletotrichum graminicola]|nr:hypothetical protein CGRA01v4_09356 [Colletotrichum graminicola]
MWIIGNGAWNGAGTRPAVGREATLQRPRSRRERRRPLNELQYGTAHTKLRLGLLSTGDHIGTHEGTPYVDVKFAPADGDLHLSHSSGGDSPTPTGTSSTAASPPLGQLPRPLVPQQCGLSPTVRQTSTTGRHRRGCSATTSQRIISRTRTWRMFD